MQIIREKGAPSRQSSRRHSLRPGAERAQELFTPGKDTAAKAGGDSATAATRRPSRRSQRAGRSPSSSRRGRHAGRVFRRAETDMPTARALSRHARGPRRNAAGKAASLGRRPASRGGDDVPCRSTSLIRVPSSPASISTDAKPNQVPIEGTVVEFTLNNEGGRRFRNETGKHVSDYMAIVLDERVMGRPPVIQSAIGTRGQITMGQGRSLQEAQDLALVLRAGALPVPLQGRRSAKDRRQPRRGCDPSGARRRRARSRRSSF